MSNESWENASPRPPKGEPAPDLKNARRRKANYPDIDKPDRLPPQAPEAEQGVLGCCLLSPNESIGECIRLGLESDDFYDMRHQTIWLNLVAMYDARLPIDIITLMQRMKDFAVLDEVGGITYLNAIQDTIPSAANLTYYTEIVQEKSTLRKLIATCTDTVGRAYSFDGEVDELVDEVERNVMRISESRTQSDDVTEITPLITETDTIIESYREQRGTPGAIPTGFADLDRMMLGGMKQGEMIVLAARPSMGKTSLAMNIAEDVAVRQRIPVGVFSLEMTKQALALRMRCSNARVSLRAVIEGYARQEDYDRLSQAAFALAGRPLYIDDTPALSIMKLRAKARRMVQRWQCKLFVIDYLQLLHSTSRRAQDNRQQEISEISAGVKALAKELNVPIIVLAQLNRAIEQDKSRKPRLSDLRESGSIEQDADLVGLLYKQKPEDEDKVVETSEALAVNLLVAKQRNGPTGDIYFTFLKPYTRFEMAAPVDDRDVPAPRQTTPPEPEQQPEMI